MSSPFSFVTATPSQILTRQYNKYFSGSLTSISPPLKHKNNSQFPISHCIRVPPITSHISKHVTPTDHNALISIPTEELMYRASTVRDLAFGRRITYSPKVFIPLTKLCNDQCGYCIFAQPPTKLENPILTPDQILEIAHQGAQAGCHEALFTLGERPELRYPVAVQWLQKHGYKSTVHYLRAMCDLVLKETGLLPHANAGALSEEELSLLRPVSPSQGMMIETLRGDLECHRFAPDKTPERRMATLEAAGRLAIPFTTGILVGIGETEADRIYALQAIAESHRRYRHVQEVIVQNFLPKPGTAMWKSDPCSKEIYHRSLALARLILPTSIHLQVPPNLSEDFGDLLDCGIDDWGGVSPVTKDHVNPERPWPALERLRKVTESRDRFLAPRLTVYPEFVLESIGLSWSTTNASAGFTGMLGDGAGLNTHTPAGWDPINWVHAALRFPILDRSDAEGMARDDPGAVFPEKVDFAAQPNDGAEIRQIGNISTQWYSGAPSIPADIISGPIATSGLVAEVIQGVRKGQQVGFDEIVTLFSARGPEVRAVAQLADELRFEAVGDDITYVVNRNINYTNVCTFKCRFCGFSKGPLSLNLRGTPYLLTFEDIQQRVVEAVKFGATEVCLQGGIHPDFDGNYYIDVIRAVREASPNIHIHGFTALEVTEGARRLNESLESYLQRAKNAGLSTLPGTAAEILDDPAREHLCPDKISTAEWLEAHRIAHTVGLKSNVTIMFGAIEQPEHWARHILRTRKLQTETGGFTEFVGLPFVHMAAPLYLQKKARRGPTFRETLLMNAVARIAYHGYINNIQASWVKVGSDGVLQMLQAGCNDLGGTLMNENISRAAGARHGQQMSSAKFADLVRPLKRRLRQRSTIYGTTVPEKLSEEQQ